MEGTPREAIGRLAREKADLEARRDALQEKLGDEVRRDEWLVAGGYDAAVIERDRLEAAAELARTSATFLLEGWAPEDRLPDVEKAVRAVTDAYSLTSRDPEEGEAPPSVVRNNAFDTPFEQVTNLYSRPDPRGIDATPYMAPFYVLLFGLMLSDSGYGLLLSLACFAYIRLKKPTGMSGGFARVLFWGGISTVVWGLLVGSFFGLDFDVLFGTQDRFPLLVDPMTDPISMLILCFGLGLVHILFGIYLKMKLSFSRGDWQTAVFDNFAWVMIILGLIGLVFPATKTAGILLAAAGALMILLFKGRASRNPFKRAVSGLAELYQVTSFLSDILSYARLFALGIATGVIASVFNDLCGMLMGSPVIVLRILGVIIACALLVFLHLFNLGINTLGAFVHCARLQYVEFYGKFYEPGGREFRPLGMKTRHVRLTDKAS
ncbi:MAG: V-type ATPase 116kDa subunit family protein [Clostridia bacterium]|nr:V-type ATPase 116kDa subunit family protein [Clostridia bacterium]